MKYPFDDSAFETWTEERSTYQTDVVFKRQSRQEFVNSPRWLALRKQVLDYYGRQCMKCGDHKGIMQVDHIRPRSMYPQLTWEFNNLQVLCRPCNLAKGVSTKDYRRTAFQPKKCLTHP